MNHTLTLLGDSARRALDDTVTPRATIEAERAGMDDAAWRQLQDLGVVGADASVMSMAEHAVVIECVAAAGALVPYADSEAIGRWLASAGNLETGTGIVAVAVVDEARRQVRVGHGGASLALRGTVIPWGCRADQLLFSFRSGNRCFVALKDRREVELQRLPDMAGEPHSVVRADTIEIAVTQVREVSATRGPDAVMQRGALCRSLQMLGAMTRANELTLQYARDRKQFKRSLSDFQVIQSYLAAMAGELCAAAIAAEAAVESATGDDAFEAIATAKVRAGQAARQIASLGHQVHGAIGFTQEYPLNLWTRRLWAWREEYGNEAHWAARLGARVVARGADALWPHLTRPGAAAHG